jgi:hypothetical protein
MARTSIAFLIVIISVLQLTNAFTQPALVTRNAVKISSNTIMAAKKNKIDLSDIESRDLTREEMLDINAQNEEIMNNELQMMTIFSFVLSLPIFYLCWVAFYSD